MLEISDTSAPLPNVTAPGRNGGFSPPGGDEHLHPLSVTGAGRAGGCLRQLGNQSCTIWAWTACGWQERSFR